ncbi:MAG: hypothetical protein IPN71_09730 [Fibrobacteres bacterium]|nr:hypothetical protein [Fibrobacterota bacterium]
MESPEPSLCLPRLLEFSCLHLAADEGVLLEGGDPEHVVASWPNDLGGAYSRSAIRAAYDRSIAVLWSESGEGDAPPLAGPSPGPLPDPIHLVRDLAPSR